MPIDLSSGPNIAAGWGAPPQLSSPPIGTLVAAILADKRAREKQFGESISDTIKNVRQDRQSNAYIEAAKAANLIPQDYEAGGLGGATLGTSLAKLIQEQNQQKYMEKYYDALGGAATTRAQAAQDWADTAADVPETYTDDQGREWRRTKSGWTLIPKYGQPGQMPREQAAETEAETAYKTAQQAETAARIKAQQMEQRHGGAPTKEGFPGSRDPERQAFLRDKYLRQLQDEQRAAQEQERLKKQYPRFQNLPSAGPQTGDGMGSNGTNQKQSYATPDEIKRARARQALDDPEATEEEKRQATIILSQ